jgi:23S rRNA (guanine1835-N2)-methyltransferase
MRRRRTKDIPLSQRPVPDLVRERVRTPLVVVLGSPAEVVNLLSGIEAPGAVCWQLDLHQAARLRELLAEAGIDAKVETTPDLWDLQPVFRSAVFLPARSGERELKIDCVDQAFHVLEPGGFFIVWSSYEADPFFPALLKKVFGKTHSHFTGGQGARPDSRSDTVLWAARQGDRPRRRHEIVFQARIAGGPSCRFISRPGVFSYGRLDEGARALAEVMEVNEGDRVLDIGCGCGTNGVFASQKAGRTGHIAFVDSNVRAVALAEINARANGVESFATLASSTVEGLPARCFDVALANPPYYGHSSIARLFIERSQALLKPTGRFYLVTRQPDEVAPLVEEAFGDVGMMANRGYIVLVSG